jgi:hypothetical protein
MRWSRSSDGTTSRTAALEGAVAGADAALADLPPGQRGTADPGRGVPANPDVSPALRGRRRRVALLIDDHFAHGNLRHWAAFTKTAAELCSAAGAERVDEAVARNAFTLHGGGVSA